MSHHVEFKPTSVTDLFLNKCISAPLRIRVDLGTRCITATLQQDGSVLLNNRHYTNLQQAMESIPHPHTDSSSVWQFWAWFNPERQTWTPLEHLRAELASSNQRAEIRTSETHPLRIDSVTLPGTRARIGLTFCPGKHSPGIYGGTWQRDLKTDLAAINTWGCTALVSLIEDHEFPLLGVADFADTLAANPLQWFHLPIKDMQPPDEQFETQWASAGPQLHQQLAAGHSIVIHCRGGLGRTGLLGAKILVEAGLSPEKAIAEIRHARAHSIETYAQEHYILTQRWNDNTDKKRDTP
ncbi:putative protein-tyrosine phosphatase [hydrothermal vent metagenome]|uniref:Tyrosine specific protein phosphatases domain-containing protein n=1 Tax=hydrothermal vent metagenome TaxID=652676 RepID=A0A3B0XSU9_9ZZZZ